MWTIFLYLGIQVQENSVTLFLFFLYEASSWSEGIQQLRPSLEPKLLPWTQRWFTQTKLVFRLSQILLMRVLPILTNPSMNIQSNWTIMKLSIDRYLALLTCSCTCSIVLCFTPILDFVVIRYCSNWINCPGLFRTVELFTKLMSVKSPCMKILQ